MFPKYFTQEIYYYYRSNFVNSFVEEEVKKTTWNWNKKLLQKKCGQLISQFKSCRFNRARNWKILCNFSHLLVLYFLFFAEKYKKLKLRVRPSRQLTVVGSFHSRIMCKKRRDYVDQNLKHSSKRVKETNEKFNEL